MSKQCRPSPKTICDLPNEVLILIFQQLSCKDLINGVNHVCKRWQDVASHYSTWICAQVKATDIGDCRILEKILSIAPVLHTLDLSRTIVKESTLKTILSNTTRICNLIISDCHTEPKGRDLLIPTVHHLRPYLESLSLELRDPYFRSIEEEFILGWMPKLRSLTLVGCLYLEENTNRITLDSPFLERLDLSRFENRWYLELGVRDGLASNLITRNKERLKALYIGNMFKLDSVKACRFLTVLSLPLECVEVVSHLPLIETLMIQCDSGARPPETWTRPRALKELIVTLRQPDLKCIQFLRGIKPLALTIISDSLCKELEGCLSPDIKRLTLRCYHLRLRHLTVTILRNMALPDLQYLDVRACFLNMGVPPKILSDIHLAFPSVTVRSDRFLGYQKIREPRHNVDCHIKDSTDCSDVD